MLVEGHGRMRFGPGWRWALEFNCGKEPQYLRGVARTKSRVSIVGHEMLYLADEAVIRPHIYEYLYRLLILPLHNTLTSRYID